MRCFSLQTCLSFISYYADVAEFVLRVQPTGMPRSNAPIQHQVQPQDDTCPRSSEGIPAPQYDHSMFAASAKPWPRSAILAHTSAQSRVEKLETRRTLCVVWWGSKDHRQSDLCRTYEQRYFLTQRRWLLLPTRKRTNMQASACGEGGRGPGECTCRASLVS